MATDYGQKAKEARRAAQYELAQALGLALSEVQVSYDGLRVHFSVDVLRRAIRRIHAQHEAKTAGQLMFEADVLDEYDAPEALYQPGARTLFPSDCPSE